MVAGRWRTGLAPAWLKYGDAVASRESVLAVIYACIDEVNAQRGADEQVIKDPQTVLQGSDSALDSLGLIVLCVALEDAFAESLAVRVPLVSDLATFDGPDSPLATVAALATWVERLSADGA